MVRSLGFSRPVSSQRTQPCSAKQTHNSGLSLQGGHASISYQIPWQPAPLPPQSESAAGIPPASNIQATVTLVPKGASTALLTQHVPASSDADAMDSFLIKCKLAWYLLFPPQLHKEAASAAAAAPNLSPKELGKQRLQMILVADRCGTTPSSLVEMKRNTLTALADCMELEDLQDAQLRFSMTREGGTTYTMAVPLLQPGPYTDDGSVVSQAQPPSSTGAAVAAAAAAAAGGYYIEEYAEEAEEDDEYNNDFIYNGEYVAVEDAATAVLVGSEAAAAAAAAAAKKREVQLLLKQLKELLVDFW
ncbi:hypothetical protein COO60DRAFT_1071603 [Scenedesmus sp. NREL 46B-D3]|nr:hypothetical protein COO60DRAFT_1071603 [Scenedesmus sp. NREL 46B-D3]